MGTIATKGAILLFFFVSTICTFQATRNPLTAPLLSSFYHHYDPDSWWP